jgi:hypothetical protein
MYHAKNGLAPLNTHECVRVGIDLGSKDRTCPISLGPEISQRCNRLPISIADCADWLIWGLWTFFCEHATRRIQESALSCTDISLIRFPRTSLSSNRRLNYTLVAGKGNAVAAVALGLIEAFICDIQQLLGGLAVIGKSGNSNGEGHGV